MGTVVTLRKETHASHMPTRRKNAELRTREYLTAQEVESLIRGCKEQSQWGSRRVHDSGRLPSRPESF